MESFNDLMDKVGLIYHVDADTKVIHAFPKDKTYEWLRLSIRDMDRHSPIFKLLKEELSALGYWKNKPRGKPGFHKKIDPDQIDKVQLFPLGTCKVINGQEYYYARMVHPPK